VNQMTAGDVGTGVHDSSDALGSAAHDSAVFLAGLAQTFEAVVASVRSAYLGKDVTVRLSLCCLMAEGHLLVEDHPS
jgi:hypothetical protein